MSSLVYICKCGNNIASHIDVDQLADRVKEASGDNIPVEVVAVEFMCSGDGKEFLQRDLKTRKHERVVVAACSPRDHEHTFRDIMSESGRNPYLMQMVNIREQVAWVTENSDRAVEKALSLILGAVKRVALHTPLEDSELSIATDTLVLGAGPAGMKCALTLAEAGRKVILVEKSPAIGGKPVLFEEVAPDLECGPCLLEPMMEELLHGNNADNIELLTLSELHDLKGSYGNFIATIKQQPRRIDPSLCIGCYECIAPCPVSVTDNSDYNIGRRERSAISFAYQGVLPNAPFVETDLCLRSKGEDCRACLDACPMEGAVQLDEEEHIFEKTVGAIVAATGSDLYDMKAIPTLHYQDIPDVLTSLEFERLMSANGPTDGQLTTHNGSAPEEICIIHCAGGMEQDYIPYCSGICCTYALKFSQMIASHLPEATISHLYKELVLPGKSPLSLYEKVKEQQNTHFSRFENIDSIRIAERDGKKIISHPDGEIVADMVILCAPQVPCGDTQPLSELLDVERDRDGFFEEAGDRLDSASSKVKGIYLAGTCQSPGDIREAVNQGMAAAGYIMAGLVAGRNLNISPVVAEVDSDKCSGCRVCGAICPFKAIDIGEEDGKSVVNRVLCQGCGTCVAACPAGAISGNHFTRDQILAELEGVLL